jgi:hypothetical protein
MCIHTLFRWLRRPRRRRRSRCACVCVCACMCVSAYACVCVCVCVRQNKTSTEVKETYKHWHTPGTGAWGSMHRSPPPHLQTLKHTRNRSLRKRPTTVSKETYHSVKRDLQCQKRPTNTDTHPEQELEEAERMFRSCYAQVSCEEEDTCHMIHVICSVLAMHRSLVLLMCC